MVVVVLMGDLEEKSFGRTLADALARSGGVIHVRGKSELIHRPFEGQTHFLLYECEEAPRFCLESALFLFKNRISHFTGLSIPAGCLAIVDAGNLAALSVLKKSGVSAITCGMSARDTLTLSSSKERSAAVCIQRQMVSLSGRTLDEREIPVSFESRHDPFSILAACAVLMLADREPEEALELS